MGKSSLVTRISTVYASPANMVIDSKNGSTLVAPLAFMAATDGLTNGVEPPSAGCEWQPTVHVFELKRPPRPAELVKSGGEPGGIGWPCTPSLHESHVPSISVER